ncbi:UNVERIFIED_CONTAM: hypothetical protein Slati_0774300 [Sesamum latifolium]|uniref:RNase H type-1 domain-containing protein n=1 Tax=Sesamum latifolium TaxID=2727402 RepID=A0AAW2XNN7_9LAMI
MANWYRPCCEYLEGSVDTPSNLVSGYYSYPAARLNFLEDRDLILQIPLSQVCTPDLLVWHYSSNGLYSVHSAYHLALSLVIPAGASEQPGGGGLDVLCGKRKFLTRRGVLMASYPDLLPTASNLHKRMPFESGCCPFCGTEDEIPIHTLLRCSFARQVWALSGIRWSDIDSLVPTVEEWFKLLVLKLSPPLFNLVAMFCWTIWWSRNLKCAKKEFLAPLQTSLKLTLMGGGGVREGSRVLGLGVIVRNAEGLVLEWISSRVDRGGSAFLDESFAAREALRLALRRQWNRVILEGDCYSLLQKLSSSLSDYSFSSSIVEDSRSFASELEHVSYSYVRMSCNSAADLLAQLAFNQEGDSSSVPPGLISVLSGDLAV